jgi:hypothetical protein
MNEKSKPANEPPGEGTLVEEADLEQLAKAGRKPPKAKRYRIRVDDEHFVTAHPALTGRGILELAGKLPPDAFILTQKTRGGGLHTLALDELVDFTKPGIERFTTLPRQVQEG